MFHSPMNNISYVILDKLRNFGKTNLTVRYYIILSFNFSHIGSADCLLVDVVCIMIELALDDRNIAGTTEAFHRLCFFIAAQTAQVTQQMPFQIVQVAETISRSRSLVIW